MSEPSAVEPPPDPRLDGFRRIGGGVVATVVVATLFFGAAVRDRSDPEAVTAGGGSPGASAPTAGPSTTPAPVPSTGAAPDPVTADASIGGRAAPDALGASTSTAPAPLPITGEADADPPTDPGSTPPTTRPWADAHPAPLPGGPPEEGPPDGDFSGILAMVERWAANAPARYTFRLTTFEGHDLAAPPAADGSPGPWSTEQHGPYDLTVERVGDREMVVAATDATTGTPVPFVAFDPAAPPAAHLERLAWFTISDIWEFAAAYSVWCYCGNRSVATGQPVDGVPSVVDLTSPITSYRFEVSGFWIG